MAQIIFGSYLAERDGLCRPFCAEEFCLCKDELCRFVLQVGWVAVFSQDTFNQNFDLRPSAFAKRPVNGYAFADLGDELSGDDF